MSCAGCRTGEPVESYLEGDTLYLKNVEPDGKSMLLVNAPAATNLRYYKVGGRQYRAGGYIKKFEVLNEDLPYMLDVIIRAQPAFFLLKPTPPPTIEFEQVEDEQANSEEQQTLVENDEVLQADVPKRRRKRKAEAEQLENPGEEQEIN